MIRPEEAERWQGEFTRSAAGSETLLPAVSGAGDRTRAF